jgi:hypothetical protein
VRVSPQVLTCMAPILRLDISTGARTSLPSSRSFASTNAAVMSFKGCLRHPLRILYFLHAHGLTRGLFVYLCLWQSDFTPKHQPEGTEKWVYPSEQQYFNAMKVRRKGEGGMHHGVACRLVGFTDAIELGAPDSLSWCLLCVSICMCGHGRSEQGVQRA